MTTSLADIYPLCFKGLRKVFDNYKDIPDVWKSIYKNVKQELLIEYDQEMKGLGYADKLKEREGYSEDNFQALYKFPYEVESWGKKFAVTEDAVMFNQYKNQFNMSASNAKQSLVNTKKANSMKLFNNAFVGNLLPDGLPLCAVNRPVANGTYSNATAVGVALTAAAVSDAIINIRKMKIANGMLAGVKAQHLLVSPPNQVKASVLLNSRLKTNVGTQAGGENGMNDVNVIYTDSYVPKGVLVSDYLLSATAWFLLTDAEQGFSYRTYKDIMYNTWPDYNLRVMYNSAIERYVFGCGNPRAVYGSVGA